MRLRRRSSDVAASAEAATRAREDANARLAAVRDVISVQKERARHERETVIAALKKMREQNNLAALIIDNIERETGDDTGAPGS